jgi:methyltransferase of ATP-grasp peptide maturase system
MTSTMAADLRAALVEKLTSDGVVSDPEWRHAFAAVPREVFVPYFFQPRRDRPGWRLVEANQEWRESVYTDEALVTQMNGDETAVDLARHDGLVEGQPTSSSSAPTLMASMLEALGVETGMRVLEIGTGTGYNAALLSHRLGAGQVTTVEIDPELTANARARLAEAGYTPTVICADGARGYAEGATYDRVIATVALPALPSAWLEQTRPGAVIVIPLRLAGHGGLMAQLTRDPQGGAVGRFLTQYGGFMSTRDTTTPGSATIRPSLLVDARPTDVPAQAVTGSHPAAFYLSLRSPSPYSVFGFRPDDPAGTPQTWGYGQDGSTFALTTVDGIGLAGADGPLWPALEAAYIEWREFGQPVRDRFGLTVHPDGEHVVWIDDSRSPVATFA